MNNNLTIAQSLSPAEVLCIRQYANDLWSNMAGDLLQAVAEEKNKPITAVTVSRADVLGLVCDAGRLEESLRRKEAKLANAVRDMPFADLKKLLIPAFAHARYGL